MPVTISGSTGISGVDGSAGTPALIGSDADTGIFLAAGQVSASVNGTAGNVPLVSGTAQVSTSGTSIDFTGIPSWVKRITVMFDGVSTNGTSPPVLRLGTSAGIAATGYNGSNYCHNTTASNVITSTTDFRIGFNTSNWAAARLASGSIYLATIGSNIWTANGTIGTDTTVAYGTAGSITLASALTQIRITTVNGTDTFDAGSINIMYE